MTEGGRAQEWVAPATRAEATAMINELSHDITLILAQLAEGVDAWCERTGRPTSEHAQWRRRALFAKAYKERQLRECKRVRQELADEHAGGQDHRGAHKLEELCVQVIHEWLACRRDARLTSPLDAAIAALAAEFDVAVTPDSLADECTLHGVGDGRYARVSTAG